MRSDRASFIFMQGGDIGDTGDAAIATVRAATLQWASHGQAVASANPIH